MGDRPPGLDLRTGSPFGPGPADREGQIAALLAVQPAGDGSILAGAPEPGNRDAVDPDRRRQAPLPRGPDRAGDVVTVIGRALPFDQLPRSGAGHLAEGHDLQADPEIAADLAEARAAGILETDPAEAWGNAAIPGFGSAARRGRRSSTRTRPVPRSRRRPRPRWPSGRSRSRRTSSSSPRPMTSRWSSPSAPRQRRVAPPPVVPRRPARRRARDRVGDGPRDHGRPGGVRPVTPRARRGLRRRRLVAVVVGSSSSRPTTTSSPCASGSTRPGRTSTSSSSSASTSCRTSSRPSAASWPGSRRC